MTWPSAHSDAGERGGSGEPGGSGDGLPGGPDDGGPLHRHAGEDTRPEWAARALGVPAGPAEGVLGAAGESHPGILGPDTVLPRRPRVPVRVALAREGRLAVALLVAGLGVDVLWRAIAPDISRTGNPLEAAAAVDGTLALLGVVAGGVVGAAVLAWPGPRPLARTAVALVVSALAASIAWWFQGTPAHLAAAVVVVAVLAAAALLRRGGVPTGRAAALAGCGLLAGVALWLLARGLGASPLRATSAVLVWPLVTAGTLFVGAMFPALSRRLDEDRIAAEG